MELVQIFDWTPLKGYPTLAKIYQKRRTHHRKTLIIIHASREIQTHDPKVQADQNRSHLTATVIGLSSVWKSRISYKAFNLNLETFIIIAVSVCYRIDVNEINSRTKGLAKIIWNGRHNNYFTIEQQNVSEKNAALTHSLMHATSHHT